MRLYWSAVEHHVGAGYSREQNETGIGSILVPEHKLSPAWRPCTKKGQTGVWPNFLRLGESSHNRVPSTSDGLEADECSVGCRMEY